MIELTNIHKSFGKVQALHGVNLKAEAGSIHGIVGENGAGKSTLMKVLTGFIARSGGEIFFNGRKARLDGPKDALRLGIGMLYQGRIIAMGTPDEIRRSADPRVQQFIEGRAEGPLSD